MQAVKLFEESGGLVGLETLEYANNEPLRQQADNILDTYFYKDEENGTVSILWFSAVLLSLDRSRRNRAGPMSILTSIHKKFFWFKWNLVCG